jgi:exodeoxyribonuclease VII large subunit
MTRLSNSVVSLFTPPTAPKVEQKVMSVGELVLQVKQSIESGYRDVAVVGEVSSFKPWRSGHWYFDLKDEQAVLPAVMFKGNCGRVRFELQDGMKVLLRGRVSVYAPQSKIQILVEEIEPIGKGALALAFEQLKKKLEHEGLFAPTHKKKLPPFPLQVGLVTSPQGAVLQDMLRIFRQRMPGVNILLSPARVQGPGAANEIADALKRLDGLKTCDVIIVGRGV